MSYHRLWLILMVATVNLSKQVTHESKLLCIIMYVLALNNYINNKLGDFKIY